MTVPTVTWPADVNQNMVAGSYSETPAESKATFAPSVGPAMERRRVSLNNPARAWRSKLTEAEKTSLDAYWCVALKQGVYNVSRKNPKTGATFTGRFTAPPTYSDAGPGHYFVDLKFVDLT